MQSWEQRGTAYLMSELSAARQHRLQCWQAACASHASGREHGSPKGLWGRERAARARAAPVKGQARAVVSAMLRAAMRASARTCELTFKSFGSVRGEQRACGSASAEIRPASAQRGACTLRIGWRRLRQRSAGAKQDRDDADVMLARLWQRHRPCAVATGGALVQAARRASSPSCCAVQGRRRLQARQRWLRGRRSCGSA